MAINPGVRAAIILLTNVPTETPGQAAERVEWYRCRPVIEELHKGMKSGCGVESMQFEHAARLEPAIALLSVVAAALLQLRQVARRPEAHATPTDAGRPPPVRPRAERLASQTAPRRPERVRVRDGPGHLGGHPNRKGDGFPGWLTLRRAWEDLQLMVRGAEAIRCV